MSLFCHFAQHFQMCPRNAWNFVCTKFFSDNLREAPSGKSDLYCIRPIHRNTLKTIGQIHGIDSSLFRYRHARQGGISSMPLPKFNAQHTCRNASIHTVRIQFVKYHFKWIELIAVSASPETEASRSRRGAVQSKADKHRTRRWVEGRRLSSIHDNLLVGVLSQGTRGAAAALHL